MEQELTELMLDDVVDSILVSFARVHNSPKDSSVESKLLSLVKTHTVPSLQQVPELLYHRALFCSSTSQGYIMQPSQNRLVLFEHSHDKLMSIGEYAPNVWLWHKEGTHEFIGLFSFYEKTLFKGVIWHDWRNIVTNRLEHQEIQIDLNNRVAE